MFVYHVVTKIENASFCRVFVIKVSFQSFFTQVVLKSSTNFLKTYRNTKMKFLFNFKASCVAKRRLKFTKP